MLKSRIIDFVGRQLVQRPCCCECGEQEAIKRRVNAGRHGLLDDLDAAAGIVGEVFGNERFAQRLDAGLFDETLPRIAFQKLYRRRFRAPAALTH
jgi:hypothetical protein